MKIFTLMLVCLFGMGIFSCKSRYIPENYKHNQLFFGSGGGFTGVVSTYCLQESGRLFYQESLDSTYTEVKRLPKADADSLFMQIKEMELEKYQMNMPGNMYSFIRLKLEDGDHNIVWDKMNPKIKPDVESLYGKLMDFTRITR